jgi:hypothetical protein
MPRQFQDAAHGATTEAATTCARLRARLLYRINRYAIAPDADAEALRLSALAACRELLAAEQKRHRHHLPAITKTT